MKRRIQIMGAASAVTLAFVIFIVTAPLAAKSPLGMVVFKKGSVKVIRSGKTKRAGVNFLVEAGDTIRTASGARVSVQLSSGVIFQVGPSSAMKINSLGKRINLGLKRGSMSGRFKRGKSRSMRIQTPTAIAGVRGTDFIVEVNDSGGAKPDSKVMVDKGAVNVKDARTGKQAMVKAGNKGVVSVTRGIQTGIMEAYEKQKFAIFEQFNRQKKANIEMLMEMKRKNRDMFNRQNQP